MYARRSSRQLTQIPGLVNETHKIDGNI